MALFVEVWGLVVVSQKQSLHLGCAFGWWWGAVEWGLHYLKEIIFFGWEVGMVGLGSAGGGGGGRRAPLGGGEGESPLLSGGWLSFLPTLSTQGESPPGWREGAPLGGGEGER